MIFAIFFAFLAIFAVNLRWLRVRGVFAVPMCAPEPIF